jgi:7,8-dihydropterin-6-yl-methyl-4-(beta-D-ribofuranosyl)aminobenzene 5'-phosphate synthase
MQSMNVDVSRLEAVVISHEHWDHTGGLWEILKMKEGLRVFACPGFSLGFKARVRALKCLIAEVNKLTEITDDFYTTGEIPGEYKGENTPEQALVVTTDKGISVVTGCSHPGIVKIMENIKKSFPNQIFHFVMGGFHLLDKDRRTISSIVEEFKRLGVRKVGPCHCTGKKATRAFRREYQGNFIPISVGLSLDI